jgi:protein-disulfide isomerase
MNKLRILFLILIFSLSLSSNNFAEEQSNLANFVVRNYSALEVPTVGSNNPDYTIVEFFDYRCGYCSKQANDYAELLNSYKNVKIIYLEFPIFGGISETASKIALEVWKQNPDLYFQIHNGFMKLGPKMKKDSLIDLLNSNGLDGIGLLTKVEAETSNPIIDSNKKLAKNLGLRGTPASIVNDTIFPGYVKLASLEKMINQ